jgi:YD repeat-containing protein
VRAATGNSWKYTYETDNYGLTKLTYPTGGEINYSYAPVSFPTGGTFVYFRVISQRSTSGRDIPAGTWTYQYAPGGNSGIGTAGAVTTVLAPNDMKEVYKYYSWDNCGSGYVWRVGRPMSRELYQNNALIEQETYTWGQGTQISLNHIESAAWGGIIKSDSSVYLPLMTSTAITRDGQSYSTTYSIHDTYGNPKTILESGNKTRNTALTYWYDASINIVKGKPLTEIVTGGFPGSFTTTYTYYDSLTGPEKIGLLKQISKYGIITKYDYSTNGNLWKITDANNKVWTYGWSNGRISSIAKPVYTISRVINVNGTITSETDGKGQKTSYLYDGNLRLTKVTPPLGNPITFEYPLDSSYRKEIRGSYYIFAYFDGFGRSSGTLNSKGVTSDTDFKAYGTKNFTDTNVGDKGVYDAFERVDLITHKDNTTIDYAYSGSNVTVTDEATKATLLTYNAFGNPDEKLLVSVKDSLNNTATYGYNILGSLTSISFGGVSRTFSYSTKNFLISEINPETGTLTYGRDNVGNLTSKTDTTGATTYGYDAIYRLIAVSKGGVSISFGYDNADNRISVISPSANQSFIYDAANRITKKSETILGTLYSTQFAYDANDNLTGITYPSGLRTLAYQYNGNNEVTTVSGYLSSASYNLAGQPLSYTFPNGITNTFTYNNRFLPTGITAGSVLKKTFGYDSRGNTISILDGYNSSRNQTLSYDNLNRLTGFNGAWGTGSFTYSVAGNRLAKTVAGVGTTYGYSNNRLISASGGEPGSYGYDGVGRVTSGTWGSQSYNLTYDNFNNVATFLSRCYRSCK